MIYKYYSGTNLGFNTVMESKIWLSSASKFNDPYDSAFIINMHSKLRYDPINERKLAIQEYMEQVTQNEKSKKLQGMIKIACFAEEQDNLLMWSHYAAEHRGFCVGYKLKKMISMIPKNLMIVPVIYSATRPVTKDNGSIYGNYETILTKSSEWSYEKEWRLIYISDKSDDGEKKDFILPEVLYFGSRSFYINDNDNLKKYNNSNELGVNLSYSEMMARDDFYASIDSILENAHKHKIKMFRYNLCTEDEKFTLVPQIIKY